MDSILTSIKQLLGISENDTNFDAELIIYINGALSTLTQLGANEEGFSIQDKTSIWVDFYGTGKNLEFIKSLVFLKVRLIFDPPQNSFLVKAVETQIQELEWRINSEVDPAFLL